MKKKTTSPHRLRTKKRAPQKSLKANLALQKLTATRAEQLSAPHAIENELSEVKKGLSTLRGNHRKNLWQQVARAYGLALFLREDRSAWVDFCQLGDWKRLRQRPRGARPTDALKYVLRYVVGFKGKTASKRASKFNAALSGFFNQNVPANQIEEKIRSAGGIQALASANAKRPRSVKPKEAETSAKAAGDDTAPEIVLKLRGDSVLELLSMETALPIHLEIRFRRMRLKGNNLSGRLLGFKVVPKSR